MDKETIYGLPVPSPIWEITKWVFNILLNVTEILKEHVALFGTVIILVMGWASIKGLPLYLYFADNKPSEFLFPKTTGIVMVGISMLVILGYFIRFGKDAMNWFQKKKKGAKGG